MAGGRSGEGDDVDGSSVGLTVGGVDDGKSVGAGDVLAVGCTLVGWTEGVDVCTGEEGTVEVGGVVEGTTVGLSVNALGT